MLIFQNNTLEMLCSHARAEYPEECCGILLGKRENGQRSVCSVIQTHNAAVEKQNKVHFLIDPLEALRAEIAAEQEQLEVVGFYHSHPDYDASASDEDLLHMIPGYSYPIISIKNDECVSMRCFEKLLQADTDAHEEILIKEKQNADFSIHFGNTASLCK
ncbi:MAG: M67 family metallopeptidase [Clostridia bacterium]|nr:M67 family metallopeptidase [Clostridia bacterium]